MKVYVGSVDCYSAVLVDEGADTIQCNGVDKGKGGPCRPIQHAARKRGGFVDRLGRRVASARFLPDLWWPNGWRTDS